MAAYGCIFQPLFGCCALQMLISFNKSLEVTFKLKQAIDIDMLYEKQFFEFKINVVSIGALLVFFFAFSYTGLFSCGTFMNKYDVIRVKKGTVEICVTICVNKKV